ncbi:MAG TPA: radical SAM family heme chaperone HemW [Gemmatimonadaceae bacterium]
MTTVAYFGVPSDLRPRHIYVHVPFCARRCSYCDFSIAVRRNVPVDEYVNAVASELSLRSPGDMPWPIDTLYFGGGTPSRLGGSGVAKLLDVFRRRVQLTGGEEITLETNPEDVSLDSIRAWRDAGVNRLSLGSQSFDDDVLKWMHRTHDASAIARAVDAARTVGIDNISLDLIFALPERNARSWENDVTRALELEPSHLSLYGLTIEPHTPLGRWRARGDVVESPEERYEAEFLYAHDALTAAGLEHYEVSNFGRPGRRSRHNSSYWTGAAYAGLGPSAHEFDGAVRRWNVAPYAEWLERLDAGADPIDEQEQLTAENRVAEQVYLGLRTTGGLLLGDGELPHIQSWISQGWAKLVGENHRLVLTPLGWLRLDALAADLTLRRSRY